MVVEGINTLPAALQLANKYNVNMPIVMGVDRIVNLHEAPEIVVQDLMNRDAKEERPY
jgi:glycerol-3-phosphate dehydrogenase (NAD(P)+)